MQVGDLDTAKAIWDAIKARHVGAERVKEARLQTLMTEFDRLKMKEEDTIDVFAGKLSKISSKSAFLGETIEEPKLVKKYLKCLPRKKYIHMAASLEQMLDLNTTPFEDIVGRLKAFEERVADEEEETHEDTGKLMYTNADTTSEGYGITLEVEAAVVDLIGMEEVMAAGRFNNRGKHIDKDVVETPRISHVSSAISKGITPRTVPTNT